MTVCNVCKAELPPRPIEAFLRSKHEHLVPKRKMDRIRRTVVALTAWHRENGPGPAPWPMVREMYRAYAAARRHLNNHTGMEKAA